MPRPLPSLTPLPLQRRRDPFDHRDWLFELKLDGFRALAYIEHGEGRLVSRNGNTFKRFGPLAAEIAVTFGSVRNAILDGEVVCLDHDGRPLFNALLYRRTAPCFVAFDCLWLDGRDLRDLPLIERKRVLRRIIPDKPACGICLTFSGAAWTSSPRWCSGTSKASSPSSSRLRTAS